MTTPNNCNKCGGKALYESKPKPDCTVRYYCNQCGSSTQGHNFLTLGNDEAHRLALDEWEMLGSMNHVMIDIEALSQAKNAAPISIGAVFFNPSSGELGQEFYQTIKLSSSQYYGLDISASTIEWWMKQSEQARAVFEDPNRCSLKDALNRLADFIKHNAKDRDVQVWGNGPAYDNAILSTAYDKTFIKLPWKYSKDRCVRTMVELGRQIGIDPKYDTQIEGTAHNALDDAKHQARYVSTIWQALFMNRVEKSQLNIEAARQVPIEWDEAAQEQCLSDDEITSIVNAATGVPLEYNDCSHGHILYGTCLQCKREEEQTQES
ncbi:3'-5' exonuclease [Vibrio parahaemolyticus]